MVSENGRASRRLSVKEFIEAAAFDGVVIEASVNESPYEPEQGKEDAASGAPAELGWLKIAMICSGTTLLFFDWGSDIMVLVSVAEQHDTARISAMAIILVLPALCMSLRDWLFPAPGQTTKLWFVFKLAMNAQDIVVWHARVLIIVVRVPNRLRRGGRDPPRRTTSHAPIVEAT